MVEGLIHRDEHERRIKPLTLMRRRFADSASLGGKPDHVGASVVTAAGKEYQLDVVVAAEARILLIGPSFSRPLRGGAATRTDVELADLDRLFGGA